MKLISRKDYETYKRIKQFMIEHKFSEEDSRRYIKQDVHLEVSSKGMKPTKFESLDDATTSMGVSKQSLTYAHKHKRPVTTGWKDGVKAFYIK